MRLLAGMLLVCIGGGMAMAQGQLERQVPALDPRLAGPMLDAAQAILKLREVELAVLRQEMAAAQTKLRELQDYAAKCGDEKGCFLSLEGKPQ